MEFQKPKTREPLDESGLFNYALSALGRRMRTVAELRRLLKTRVEKGDTSDTKIDAVLRRLHELRYLDDKAFATDYTRLRQEGAKLGRRRVQQDLQRKGVAEEVVSTTLDAAYGEVNEEELAAAFVERKRMRKPANEKESARIVRRLLAAGFSLGTAYKLLRRWDVHGELAEAFVEVDEDAAPPECE